MIKSFNSQRELHPLPSVDVPFQPSPELEKLIEDFKAKGAKFNKLAKAFIKKYPHLFKE